MGGWASQLASDIGFQRRLDQMPNYVGDSPDARDVYRLVHRLQKRAAYLCETTVIDPDNPEACAAWIKNAGFFLRGYQKTNVLCLLQPIGRILPQGTDLVWPKNPLTPVWLGDDFSRRMSAWKKAFDIYRKEVGKYEIDDTDSREQCEKKLQKQEAACSAFFKIEQPLLLGAWLDGKGPLWGHFYNEGDRAFVPYVETALAYVLATDLKAHSL